MPEVKDEVSVELSFECWCGSCGAPMCANVNARHYRANSFNIEPCEKCLSDKYDEGYSAGFKYGKIEGFDEAQPPADAGKEE